MSENHLELGVNVDHVATLRQARGVDYPDPVAAAEVCMAAGASSITMHLREDRRHIQDADIRAVAADPALPLNLEMANVPEIVDLALEVVPEEVCLVPEKREELTTEGGLDVAGQLDALREPVGRMLDAGIRVSLFIEADPVQLDAAATLGVPVVELHTGTYCDAPDKRAELVRLIDGAGYAHGCGLQVNAGHGITLDNLGGILEIPHLKVLNIGHSIVCHAVFVGLDAAVRAMHDAMADYTGGAS